MQDAHQELQARYTVHTAYTAQTIAAGVAALQDATGQTLTVVQAVAVGLDATQAMVSEIHAAVASPSTRPVSHIPARAKLPARPIFFNGRADRLNEIVAIICKLAAARIAIMGPGGIGKTSLALAIMHNNRVIDIVGDYRFFISVEGVIDTDAASTLLAKHIGLADSSDPLSAAVAHLQSLPSALVVVDNLETLWFSNSASARADTEHFLSRLAEVSSVTLLVTSRGAIPPSGVQWSNEEFAELATLSLDAARDTFNQIAKAPIDIAERTALDTLLGEIDCVPLAVTLLSRLAQLRNSPSGLLRRWRKSRTKLLSSQADDRKLNVNTSITVSLDLLRAMTHGVESLQLLSICAHLPDGLRIPVFAQLVENFDDVDGAKDLLVEFALVMVGAEGELKMLSPIRHFIIDNHPMTRKHLALLRKIYFDMAASAPQEFADGFTARSTQFAPEYGNLTSFLMHLIGSEEPSEQLYDAVEAVSEYAYHTVPSPTLREAFLLRLTTQTAWRANVLLGLGRTRLHRGEYSLTTDNLHAARTLYAELDDRFQEAECRHLLGYYLYIQGLLDAAEQEQLAARDAFIGLDCEHNAAQCMQELGNICGQRDEYDQAIVYLTSARDTFKRHGERLYAAQCTQSLGLIQLQQGNLPAAESDFKSALSEYEAIGEQCGAAHSTEFLGGIRRRQGDYDSSETLLAAALKEYTRLGSLSDLADCHMGFGQLYRDQDKTSEALASFENARNMYEALGNQVCVRFCTADIQDLRNMP
ncbi:hypothetical protein BKA62DRAFT_453653 [Auriculariales sp. MPI-PUGE-AT-0066]|nr:hypothetical protein BKA62DRAFT_453653 [Auriculariales sp. MPI-PUGE-AT-0066]